MDSEKKIKVVLILLYFVIVYIGFSIISGREEQEINKILKNNTKNIKIYEETFGYYQQNIADLIYDSIADTKKTKELFDKIKNSDFSKKKNELEKLFEKERLIVKKFQLSHFMIVSAKGELLLDIDNDDIKNDKKDFSKDKSFRFVKENRKVFRGLERCEKSIAFRNIYPILNDSNELLGMLYISFPSYFLQKYLTVVGHLHSHVLIRKDIFTEKIWREKSKKYPYYVSAEDKNYMIAITKNHPVARCIVANGKKLKNIKKKIENGIKSDKSFTLYREVGENITLVSFFPLKDYFSKEIVAWVVSYKKDYQIGLIKKRALFLKLVLFAIVGLILLVFYMIKMQGEILKRKVKDEVIKNKIKDEQLMQQSRLAQMGEMISMIAHQWRQPLSAITATVGVLQMKTRLGKIDNETIFELSDKIIDYSRHLSSTIDDFRNFFKPNKQRQEITYKELIDGVMGIIEMSLVSKNIRLIKEFENEVPIKTYANEVKQVILNLIKNAEDALIERDVKEPFIKIEVKGKTLSVEDNAGGISEEIMDKIFNPYFSTKIKKDGTGLGLYMSKIIIEEHCKGKLRVENTKIGAKFIIEL